MSLSPPTATEIKDFRARTGMTQAALAEEVGVSLRAVEQWEGSRRLAPPMLRLALGAINERIKPWGLLEPTGGRIMRGGSGS